jgi:hypothetical protein
LVVVEVRVGNTPYSGLTEFEIGTVVALEPLHKFQDGTTGAVVVIQNEGRREWIRREKLNNSLIEK